MPNKSAATAVSSLKTSKRTKIETAGLTDSITISRPEESRALDKYIKNIHAMSKRTAHEYHLRLIGFQDFIIRSYKTTLDGIIRRINEGSEDPYGILSDYVAYLQTNYNISTLTLKQRIVTVKNFFEYYDVDISPRKFKLKVKIPKVIRKSKEALSKEDIINILNACSEIRLKTYVMLLAGTGLRAVEALSIRIKDLNLQPRPAKIFVRGEYTKTKTDRYVFLTEEVLNQLKQWLDYKHRTRRVCHKDNHTGKTISEYITPQRNDNDLVFAVYQDRNHPNPNAIYFDLVKSFGKTLDRIGKGLREESNNNRRRQITLHSFRRFVKTTISDLGYSDFSEWFIGHAGSTYWTKKDSEKAEIFRKVEPYLTFLNIPELERQGADIQTKVEELEELNQSLRNRDKMKDDAIAQLSDQLMALTARMQEFERKHTS
ncbi:MAG: tyrosine-type recombinase/integrase [Nitrososphaeraceae archaeon]